ncbi:MAG: hypothetical protein KDJ75_08405 [Alphaproteobacteria bacterium]|nr:hypothetical protein [Alphaproteobacteria bacterium]
MTENAAQSIERNRRSIIFVFNQIKQAGATNDYGNHFAMGKALSFAEEEVRDGTIKGHEVDYLLSEQLRETIKGAFSQTAQGAEYEKDTLDKLSGVCLLIREQENALNYEK